jgi:RnfABCDGE-type electron transport complex C subunit
MMLEKPEMIVEGLKIMLKLFGDNCKGLICIENNKPKAIEIMKKAVEGVDRVSVAVVKTKYPEGAERSLINAVTGRFVNSKMLPADAGCVVDNVGTVMAVYDAVKNGKPLMYRVFTVTGDAVKDPRNFLVRIGTPYRELVEAAGGFTAEPEKIISGGPMMGFALADLDVPVTKTSGALTCFLKDEVSRVHETACISCGRCLNVCPARLMPTKLAELAEAGDEEGFALQYDFTKQVSPNEISDNRILKSIQTYPIIYNKDRFHVPHEYVMYLFKYRMTYVLASMYGSSFPYGDFRSILSAINPCPDEAMTTKIMLHKSDEWKKKKNGE